MISRQFLGFKNLSSVGDIQGFKTAKKSLLAEIKNSSSNISHVRCKGWLERQIIFTT
jgi:hypothetical protein